MKQPKSKVNKTELKPKNVDLKAIEKPEVQYVVVAPDGGWGWVVVFAAFYCNFLVDGCIYSFGIYLPELVKAYKVGEASISLVSSLAYGLHYVFGPLCAALCSCYGLRATAIAGSILTAVGTISSMFQPPFWVFVLTMGVLRGIGLCFIFMPGVLATTMYFSKYRIHAMGIIMCGTGAGTAVFTYASQFLLTNLSWQMAQAAFSGMTLLCILAALTFKPLQPAKLAATSHIEPMEIHTVIFDVSSDAEPQSELEDEPILLVTRTKEQPISTAIVGTELVLEQYVQDVHETTIPREKFDKFLCCGKKRRRRRVALLHPETRKQILSPTGKTFKGRKIMPIIKLGHIQKLKQSIWKNLDFRVLKQIPFMVFCIGNSLASASIIIVFTYEKTRIMALGLGENTAVNLIASTGITNMIWRILLGVISTVPHVNYHALNIVGTCLAGIFIIASVASNSLFFQYIHCIIMGLGLACFAVFRPIVLLELVGLENVSKCIGISLLFSGIFSIIGPPFSGWLLHLTGSHGSMFWFAGIMFFLSGALFIPFTGKNAAAAEVRSIVSPDLLRQEQHQEQQSSSV